MAQSADLAHGLPFKGVVLCSTSLPQDVRLKLAEHAVEMGAVHKLDLTGDVTHLLVGDVKTPKYRYVAKSRPDIKILRPEWVEEVHKQWLAGDDVDIEACEKKCQLPALFGLHICLTGFTDVDTRNELEATVREHGADYSGDLSKQISHLIVATPQGAKYNAAKQWGLHCVSIKWLRDSIVRNMALDESLYDPLMPEDTQGKGAFKLQVKPITGKRSREEQTVEGSKRKFRRTASTRLEEHSQDLWQDISAMSGAKSDEAQDQWKENDTAKLKALAVPTSAIEPAPQSNMIFSNWRMCLQGFDSKKAARLRHVLSQDCGAEVVDSASQLRLGAAEAHCIIIPHLAPQHLYYLAKPISQTIVATEWWVERCFEAKRIIDVEQDPLSRPFWTADLPDLAGINVASTGLDRLDLRQLATIIKETGATYLETMTAELSVLISGSSAVKKEKAFYANKYNIPIVTPEWLWACIKHKSKQPFQSYKVQTASSRGSERSSSGDRPTSISKPRAKTRGPFIHEDEDTGTDSAPAPTTALPLQEVSPNLASPKKHSSAEAGKDKALLDSVRSPADINADIASLSRQLQESRSGKTPTDGETGRRRKRTLGRAASAISNRSYSADQAVDEPLDLFNEYRAEQPIIAQPSTQLGYEVPEAEAHREQMAKRMGTTFTDETIGKKLASIGTVKDTEVQTRSRRQRAR